MIVWPSLRSLEKRLSELLVNDHPTGVAIVDRRKNVYASTFPSEIVTCRTPDGSLLKLLCKCVCHKPDAVGPRPFRPLYEIDVYRYVLAPLPLTAPRFYGTWSNDASGAVWLVIEWLNQCRRVTRVEDPQTSIEAAATWIGAFHALNESRLPQPELSFLHRFDLQHFWRKLERTLTTTEGLITDYPWLSHLFEEFGEVIRILLGAQQTIIHSEYYPDNILYRAGKVYPVDWETAAVAAGEIDLASLTENWPQEVVERCKQAYLQARYASPTPDWDFERRLAAARSYVQVHWLGYEDDPLRPEWSLRTRGAWRFDQLHEAGRQLGIL
jgi:hypothetical protein